MKGGLMNERMDERKSPCVLQDFVPFGAAAQKAEKRAFFEACACACVERGVGWGVGCRWGSAAPAHSSATIL